MLTLALIGDVMLGREHPAGQAAHIDACALANNHILDFEEQGLLNTLHTLKVARIHHAGAGINAREATASALLELGADIYYGHSAHICQGIEIYRGKPILYDTGDFIDDYAVDPMLRNDRSCLYKVIFEKGQLQRIELIPVILEVAHAALARGEDFKAISARMEMLCAEFGNRLMRRDDRLVYEVSHAMG